ncbi:MAG: hypothetical protein KKA28_20270 [Planctomycetes bacterium]|nr:hypothetical protein [Planctomycetota bacterium]MCG2679124.1 hypothetical protein [Kiritimatiellia bacterium]
MVKKVHDNQSSGYIGEDEFKSWASKMGWFATKIDQDFGIDFICQIRGERISEKSSVMTGKLLAVSVRSTTTDGDAIKISRDDADHLLKLNTPMVFAIVQRGSQEEQAKIAIKFPDDAFICELDAFLRSKAKHHKLRFSDAITDLRKIKFNAERLFKESHADKLFLFRAELRLKGVLPDAQIEIIHTKEGGRAYIRSKQFPNPIHITQRPDVMDALRDIEVPLNALLPSLKGYTLEVISGIPEKDKVSNLAMASEDYGRTSSTSLSGAEKIVRGSGWNSKSEVDESSGMIERLRKELSLWNFNTALEIADQIEKSLDKARPQIGPIAPEIFVLLARVHTIWAELHPSESQHHIERAKASLVKTEPFLDGNNLLKAEVIALKASHENLEKGSDAALSFIEGHIDPYAIRIRTALLLKQQKIVEALHCIEDLEPHERWCDIAVTVYALNDKYEKAHDLIRWAARLPNRSFYFQCVVRLAEAMVNHTLANYAKGVNILPSDITFLERKRIENVIETLRPVLQPIQAAGRPTSELDMAALKIAWRANHLLKKREIVSELMTLMLKWTPIPLDLARGVVSGYIEAPSDLPNRLREEHPGDIDAGILAVVVQTGFLYQHKEAFLKAKDLLPLAKSDEKKEELFGIFQEISQYLELTEIEECESIAGSLVEQNPKLRALFYGSIALRQGDADKAIDILDEQKSEEDIIWLQLRGNALLKKQQLAEAVEFFFQAAQKSLDPALLQKASNIAYHAGKFDIAAWCSERLAEILPQNIAVRVNLAHIYTSILNNPEKAAIQLQIIHEAEPGNQKYTFNLAICLAQLLQFQDSLPLFDELCKQETPSLQAVLGRSQVHHGLGDPKQALTSLSPFRVRFWETPDFLMEYMTVAYAAGDDAAADEALIKMNQLREQGKVEPETFRVLHMDEGLGPIKELIDQAYVRDQLCHNEMLKGLMPWLWADRISGKTAYWGWRIRTRVMEWIGDEPANRARFSIYSTNGFHAGISERGRNELLQLECPSIGTKVVADISALITLHRLGLLNAAAEYFGEILIPMAYLSTVLEDSRKMVLPQRSSKESAEQIAKQIDSGHILVLNEDLEATSALPIVNEYSEADGHKYHLIDLIQPLYTTGILSEADFSYITRVCKKLSAVDETHMPLGQFQEVIIDLTTLDTIANFKFLDALVKFYRIRIHTQAQQEVRQRLESIACQEETHSWHMDLWSRLRSDTRFRFVPHIVPEQMHKRDGDANDFLPFLASFIAQRTKTPLLVDDRVPQALTLNDMSDVPHAAFGSDMVVLALMAAGKVDAGTAAAAIRQLMTWRYRFIVPTPEIIKALADPYRENPPGQFLRQVAEYVHDCMRDVGLFGGPEKTEMGESMAIRLFRAWLSIIAEFLILVWADKKYAKESAVKLTKWSCSEFLPSWPRVAEGRKKIQGAQIAPKVFLTHAFLKTVEHLNEPRMVEAMKALKEGLCLADDEYIRIVTGFLNDTSRKTARS